MSPLSLIRALRNSSGAQLEGWQGDLSCLFLKIEKSVLILGKKCPDCVPLWNKFVALRASRRNSPKLFPAESYFSWVFDKMFIEVP